MPVMPQGLRPDQERAEHNTHPKPFVWTASVEKIIAKVNRCKAILNAHH
jgi:hypothetical protein